LLKKNSGKSIFYQRQDSFILQNVKNASAKLGEEKGVYRVKFGLAYLGIYALCIGLSGFGLLMFLGVDSIFEKVVSAVFFAVVSLPLVFLLIRTVPTVFDELRVYENGFTYKSRKGMQTCLWNQVKDRADVLDTGNRLKVTSIVKRNNEKIVFAFQMRGLDVVRHELDEYEFSKIPASEKMTAAEADALEPKTLGELRETYHTKNNWTEIFPLGALLFLAAFGVILPIANENIWLVPACSLPTVLLFLAYLWNAIRLRKDELTIYENGFTYLSGKTFSTCLWHEIVDYQNVRRGPEIAGIKKEDGTWINISTHMQGTDELRPHLRTVIEYTGPED
jgi:hypothetical protein